MEARHGLLAKHSITVITVRNIELINTNLNRNMSLTAALSRQMIEAIRPTIIKSLHHQLSNRVVLFKSIIREINVAPS